jgi:hypothetical protein
MKNNLLKIIILTVALILCFSYPSLLSAQDTESSEENILPDYEFTQDDLRLLSIPAVCFVTSIWFANVYDPNIQKWSEMLFYGPFNGTGFCVNPKNGTIVTAGHVVDVSYVELKWGILDTYISNNYPDDYFTLTESDWNQIYDTFKVEGADGPEPDREIWVQFNTANSSIPDNPSENFIRAEVLDFSPFDQRDIAILKITPLIGRALSSTILGDSSKIEIQDEVLIVGYPWTSNIGQDNPLSPTVTQGTVSGKIILFGTEVLQVQGDARPGNSGGPVLGADGSVIGILTMGTDSTNNYLRPSNDIKEMLETENKLGLVDQEWRIGLIMYRLNHYSEAIKHFDAVLNLSSGHLLAQEYKARAQENISEDIPYIEEKEIIAEISEEEPAQIETITKISKLSLNLIIFAIILPVLFILLIVLVTLILLRRRNMKQKVLAPEDDSKISISKNKKEKKTQKENGTDAEILHCNSCGYDVEKGQVICHNCGFKLK